MDTGEYDSFLVRCWRERSHRVQSVSGQSGQNQPSRWCGEIEHIQSGKRWSFRSLSELLLFLQQVASNPEPKVPSNSDNSLMKL